MNNPLLKVEALDIHYGELLAVKEISLSVGTAQIISMIGANGSGKSTVLKTITGLMPPTNGTIAFRGQDITGLKPYETVDLGISMVPEGRQIFPRMTVKENLLIGSYTPRARKNAEQSCRKIFQLFPILEERQDQLGTNLSGGEQQMLAIGRALMSDPTIILFDEISLGLSPIIIKSIYEKIKQINEAGITVILVEQDIKRSLKVCDWACVMQEGRMVLEGEPKSISEDQVKQAYFGSLENGSAEMVSEPSMPARVKPGMASEKRL